MFNGGLCSTSIRGNGRRLDEFTRILHHTPSVGHRLGELTNYKVLSIEVAYLDRGTLYHLCSTSMEWIVHCQSLGS